MTEKIAITIITSSSTLVAVGIGFLLGEGGRYWREHSRISKLKGMINQELKSILAQIPQKRGILYQMIEALKKKAFLSGMSVQTLTIGYKQHIHEFYVHLSPLERNCLHVLYERLILADRLLFSFEHDFQVALEQKIMDDPFKAYIDRLTEIGDLYNVVENLIKSYLEGKPVDVFYIET